jgi:hypothetical protein
MPGDLYRKRNQLAIGAGKILQKEMAIWGRVGNSLTFPPQMASDNRQKVQISFKTAL